MTLRAKLFVMAGLVGVACGQIREQNALSLMSLAVLVWLFVEWVQFSWLIWFELPNLQIARTVNGRSEPTGILWAGRKVTMGVTVLARNGSIGPVILLRDVIPEIIELIPESEVQLSPRAQDGRDSVNSPSMASWLIGDALPVNCCHLYTRFSSKQFDYSARVRAAGEALLPGFHVTLQSPHGFFQSVRFIKHPQRFRVLPSTTVSSEAVPRVKRTNSLPQHGIHRLQRSGMGSELLELREYVPGDPPKSIAWKVSARRGKLMTRQYDSEVPVRVQLLIDGSYSTRVGGFGLRMLDQLTFVAASVARAAVSVGDPVGAILLDERGSRRIPASSGERGFLRLMETLADFIANPPPYAARLTTQLHDAALRYCGERYPELFELHLAQLPFTVFPIVPSRRRIFHERLILAGVFATCFDLPLRTQIELVCDDDQMAKCMRRFLAQCGWAWMEPFEASPNETVQSPLQTNESNVSLSAALTNSVQHARDNEVFVVLADLFQVAPNIERLMASIKLAVARHHRVVFACPSPTFRRPTAESVVPKTDTLQALLDASDQIRLRESATKLRRLLGSAGAVVAIAGEREAIRLVLCEMEIARTGRISQRGVRT